MVEIGGGAVAFAEGLEALGIGGSGVDGAVAGLDGLDAVFGVFACRVEQAGADAALRRGRHGEASWGVRGFLGFWCVRKRASARLDFDRVVAGLSGPAGKVGGAKVL